MPLLQTTTGFETFAQSSAKVYAFHMPSRQFPGKENNLSVVARSGSAIQSVGAPNQFPPAAGLRPEMGKWTTQTFDIPEGALVKVFAHRSAGFGQMRVMASVILRIRAQAALRRVGAILTQNSKAVITRANFEGRFDILRPHEAQAMGAVIPPNFANTFEDHAVRRAFEIAELQPEILPPEIIEQRTVESTSGEQTQVTTVRRRRAIDL